MNIYKDLGLGKLQPGTPQKIHKIEKELYEILYSDIVYFITDQYVI